VIIFAGSEYARGESGLPKIVRVAAAVQRAGAMAKYVASYVS
jgi:hypothetical protein